MISFQAHHYITDIVFFLWTQCHVFLSSEKERMVVLLLWLLWQDVDRVDGVPLRFTNRVDFDQVTGQVYFTDSSMQYKRSQHEMVTTHQDRGFDGPPHDVRPMDVGRHHAPSRDDIPKWRRAPLTLLSHRLGRASC